MLNACRGEVPREEWHKVGADFHVEIARLSGNPFLAKAIEAVMTRLSRARWLEVWTETSREQAWSEHRRILGFIRSKQADDAAREASAHVRDTRDRLLRAERRPARLARAGLCHRRMSLICNSYRSNIALQQDSLTFFVGECLLTR
jgi:DNA-binding GntR family transcriptional regulator